MAAVTKRLWIGIYLVLWTGCAQNPMDPDAQFTPTPRDGASLDVDSGSMSRPDSSTARTDSGVSDAGLQPDAASEEDAATPTDAGRLRPADAMIVELPDGSLSIRDSGGSACTRPPPRCMEGRAYCCEGGSRRGSWVCPEFSCPGGDCCGFVER